MNTSLCQFTDETELELALSEPTPALVAVLQRLPGDLLVLGAGGKMGPTLAWMARRGADAAASPRRIVAVSRFQEPGHRTWFESRGVATIACDLLDPAQVDALPDAPLIVLMSGLKFGSSAQPGLTWATNCLIPANVLRRYAGSRCAAFSTGNVYGLTSPGSSGARETDPPAPIGEYAMSCLGRERVIEHAAAAFHTPTVILRLNYACDLRYGVLVDLARAIRRGEPIDLAMGHFNTIWQGDANDLALRSLALAEEQARVLNLTGLETLSVRDVAQRLGASIGRPPILRGTEAPDALLSNASLMAQQLGRPRVSAEELLAWVAGWVGSGGATLGKPTHFQERKGSF